MSQAVTVLCGHTEMDWEKLTVAAQLIGSTEIFDTTVKAGTNGIPIIDDVRTQVEDKRQLMLSSELRHTRSYEATDPRDKVYAL